MVEFRSRPDGTKYPITGREGRGGVAVAAGATALAIAAYSGGGAATTGAAGSAVGESLAVRTSHAKQSARNGQQDKAWQRMRLRLKRQPSIEHHVDCVVHSFGQVQEFFVRNPCRSLTRTLVPLEDESGDSIVVSIAWVRMPTARQARRLDRLDYRDGTGDVTALGHHLLAAQGVSFTGEHYASDVKKTLFVRAEAAPVRGTPNPELLDAAAEVGVLLPPP
ncbi:hypothetical protein GCM10011581_20770 [Saccharopolyspora subtropica]|uniref:Uncharacterized protein n=1 Tax=Saccharopolyspora thermophila TaxID=89367 RepID=A0A917JTK2_9PSEU|nr:hypothetical protein [Saccharopolyspora subtropica]GGI83380.1 hypothetical protein GCM10011581_20770 [Saccharopolyspora subtropica]